MKCVFRSKIYQNEENGYTIAEFWTKDDSVPVAARDKTWQDGWCITVFGHNLPLSEKVEVEMVGNWVKHPKYGLQFEVETFMEVVERTKEGIIEYLSSGAIKGVGRKTAEAIFAVFGMETLKVLEENPEKLLSVRGISHTKLQDIVDDYNKNQPFRELMTFLAPFGITPKKVQMILEAFGSQSPTIVKNRPYMLCAIKGMGFLTVDAIAKKCCGSLNDPMRISGCVSYTLKQAAQEGHLYLMQQDLIDRCLEVLNKDLLQQTVYDRDVQNVLYRLTLQKSIVVESQRVYECSNYIAEKETARMAVDLLLQTFPQYPQIDIPIQEAEQALHIRLSESQRQAVKMVFTHPLSIITGGPGTGKTTVLKVVLYIHKKLCKGEVQLMAPTGRAARRMAESTSESNASTMHMALGLVGDEAFADFTELSAAFYNVDEYSMVEMKLAYEFFRHLPGNARVVLIGDVDQLPSVGAGDVFRQFIGCGLIPVTVLDLVYRQSEDSLINFNAVQIKQNKTMLQYGSDFQLVECKSADEAASLIHQIYTQEVAVSDVDSVQVLTPFRKRTASGVVELNKKLREIVNPKVRGHVELKIGAQTYRVGDKVIQTQNTEVVSNGDIGMIQSIYKDEIDEMKVDILFSDNRKVSYATEQMDNIDLAYATTIHKSQGSEYPVVIIPWIKEFYIMLKRNILYTAITRAKERVILVGEKSALYRAIHTDDSGKRNTALGEKMREYYQKRTGVRNNNQPEQLKLAI